LEQMLNRALESPAPALMAYQRLGVEIAPTVEDYDPEPDVLVIDAAAGLEPNRRYMERFYLAAEIVSASDRVWVEKKREIYKLHDACTCVLSVQQDRIEARVDLRTDSGWRYDIFTKADDQLVLPAFGLSCALGDLYRGTALQPRR